MPNKECNLLPKSSRKTLDGVETILGLSKCAGHNQVLLTVPWNQHLPFPFRNKIPNRNGISLKASSSDYILVTEKICVQLPHGVFKGSFFPSMSSLS